MNERRFGEAAGRLAGQVAVLLGWRPDEFWAATPAELATIFAARGEGDGAGMGRSDLQRMMEHDDG